MKVISNRVIKIKNPVTGEYESINITANETTAECIKNITEAGEEVLASIPSNYKTLIDNVDRISNEVEINNTEIDVERQRLDTFIALNEGNIQGGDLESEIIDARIGYDGTVYGSTGSAIRSQITAINEEILNQIDEIKQIKDFTSVEFDNETRLLHFYDENGLDVYDPVRIEGGGGGGGSSTSSVKLTNDTGISTINVATGSPVEISFTFTSLDEDVPTGDGTCQLTINGVAQTPFNIKQGSTTLDITQYMKSGSNSVRVKCTDVYGNYKFLVYTVSIIDLYLTSPFDDTVAYESELQFKYIPYGLIDKTIHILVDGEEVSTVETPSSGKQFTSLIGNLTHGVHRIDAYITASMEGADLESDHLIYDAMCMLNEDTAMISSIYNVSEIKQGEQVSIPYIVLDPTTLASDISLIIKSGDVVYSTQELSVDRTRHYWNTRRYPTGDVEFIIKCGELEKVHTVHVVEPDIAIEPVTNDLELYLTSSGRSNNESNPAVWEYKNVTTTFTNVNWDSTGWVPDENGDTVLRLNGDAIAEIAFRPFENDWKPNGKTIEIEFAIRDVNNREAIVMQCMNGGVGFDITADTARLMSEQSHISCNYCDEERLRVSFVVESRNEYRLLMIYLNGIFSSAKQYPSSDIFKQNVPVNITIGSPYCGIDVYTIRSYTNALTFTEITNNYIADTADVVEKSELYEENDIYDEYQQLSYEAIKKRIPVMTIIGPLPQSKGDKKTVGIKFEHNTESDLNFEDAECSIDVQGTSSQWYIRKNYKLKFGKYYQHAKGQLPAKVFCTKADYAEATGTHNTQFANLVETMYSTKNPAQLVDERVRTTIYGYPIVIFHQKDEKSDPEFIGKYNFNYDKGAENVFGFTKDFDVECWEFCNNTSDACNFLGPIPEDWGEDFEARYPDKHKDISRFKAMHDWVLSTKDNIDKFKAEFENYFDMESAAIYYVLTFVFLMTDQRAKNMFITYWGGTINKYFFYFYDNDTQLGINNEGDLVFDYYHEDTDTVDGANVYNGQNSLLWNNFRVAFPDVIQETYQDLRNNGKLTFDLVLDHYDTNGASKWSESIYNEDADYKYVSMLRSDNDASNLYQVRGDGIDHLKYIVKNRLNYCDSKWYASDYANNYVALRIYTPTEYAGIEPNANITVTPFSNMYAGVRYKANGTLQQIRTERNVPTTFVAPNETFNDTETAIYGASEISSLGDLAPLYCGTINVSKASKLTTLKIGDATEGYANNNLVDLSVGANKLLRVIDVRNCPKLVDPLELSGCPNIEEIYATGSGITGVELPSSGYLKTLHLPETITNLTLRNQLYIEDLTIAGYDNITTLNIENCPTIDGSDIMGKCENLRYVRLTDVDWSFEDVSFLLGFAESGLGGVDEHGYTTDTPQISGTCHITTLTGSELLAVKEAYPYLTITYSNLLANLIYMNEDGSEELHRVTIVNGETGIDPVTEGIIEEPTKESTAQYHFEYSGWSFEPFGDADENALKDVTLDRCVYIAFAKTLRSYTIRFYDGSKLLENTVVPYGQIPVYTKDNPVHAEPENYEFNGWRPELTEVTGNAIYYAKYKYVGSYARELIKRTIPGDYANDRITAVDSYTFYGCSRLTSVYLPNVTRIGDSSFSGCTSLTSLDFPKVTSIRTYSFYTCSAVKTVNLPNITEVFNSSFAGCSNITKLDFHKVTSIDTYGFRNCKNLGAVILRSKTLCTLKNISAFNGTLIKPEDTSVVPTGYIYVPKALVEEYKAATNWSIFADQIRAIEDYPAITGGAN